jgi:phosphomannomutase
LLGHWAGEWPRSQQKYAVDQLASGTSGWFAARPSGTENIYKIYAESFKDQAHLEAILSEAREMVNNALNSTAPRGEQAEGQP